MSKNKKRKYKLRDTSQAGKTSSFLCSQQAYDMLVINGYTKLDEIPAIVSGCRKIAELIGSMTIHLMANTKDGDQRIENELSRQFDIHPSKRMNRSQWMEMIVMNMLLYGSGNAIVRPITKNGYIDDLQRFRPFGSQERTSVVAQDGLRQDVLLGQGKDEGLHQGLAQLFFPGAHGIC